MNTENADGSVLVTGASGLLGGAIVNRLRARNNQVVATDLQPKNDDVFACDVTDRGVLERLVSSHDVVGIIHCGGISGPMVCRDNPLAIVDVNVGGTANILEVARKHAMRRVVVCSSLTVYGSTSDKRITEDCTTSPSSVYAATKVASEALASAYSKQESLDCISLRIGTVYGPGRSTACFVRTLLQNAIEGLETNIDYGRSFPRQYLYVEDAVTALIRAWDVVEHQHSTFNIHGGTYYTMPEIAEIAAKEVPQVRATFGEGPDPDDPDWQGPLSGELAKDELGFEPRWTLEDGIKKYYEALLGGTA